MKAIRYADFGLDEYRGRTSRMQAAMDKAGIDTAVIANPQNLRYLFGFKNLLQDFCPTAFIGVFVKDDPEESFIYVPHDCVAAESVWLDDDKVHFWDEGKEEGPQDDYSVNISKLTKRMEKMSLLSGRVGMELEEDWPMNPSMPFKQFERLQSLLARATLVDISSTIWSLRKIKSPAEIDYLRAANTIGLKAFKTGLDALREGDTELDLKMAIVKALFTGENDDRGFLHCAFGADGWKRANMPPTHEVKLQKNQWIYVDGGGLLKGYNADNARTVFFGDKPTDLQKRLKETVVEGNKVMFETIKPGIPIKEVYYAAQDYLKQKGFMGTSCSFGHGVGLHVHEPPNLSYSNEEVLQEGMVLAIEPWIIEKEPEGGLFNKEDVIVVTGNGADWLTEQIFD